MTNVGGTIQQHDEHLHQNEIDLFIISGSYRGHRQHTMYDIRRTTDNATGMA